MNMRFLAAIVILVATAFAATPNDLQKAKVVDVKKYDRGRIVDWYSRTPIYEDRPIYDITLELGGKQYVVRYIPGRNYYPDAWNPGQEIQVKQEKHRFFLMNGDHAVAANKVSKNECVPNPGYGTAVPVLPCP
jgi:hypothetical protein